MDKRPTHKAAFSAPPGCRQAVFLFTAVLYHFIEIRTSETVLTFHYETQPMKVCYSRVGQKGIKSLMVVSKSKSRFKYLCVVATLEWPNSLQICVMGTPAS